jgi:hypothetical protein
MRDTLYIYCIMFVSRILVTQMLCAIPAILFSVPRQQRAPRTIMMMALPALRDVRTVLLNAFALANQKYNSTLRGFILQGKWQAILFVAGQVVSTPVTPTGQWVSPTWQCGSERPRQHVAAAA